MKCALGAGTWEGWLSVAPEAMIGKELLDRAVSAFEIVRAPQEYPAPALSCWLPLNRFSLSKRPEERRS